MGERPIRAGVAKEWAEQGGPKQIHAAVMTWYGGGKDEPQDVKWKRMLAFIDVCRSGAKPPSVTYFVGQGEVCPETNRPHLQMYAEFKSAKTRSAICKTFSTAEIPVEGMWIGERRGSPQQAAAYCQKTETAAKDTQWEIGTRSAQGRRNDIHTICQAIDEGMTIREISKQFPVDYVMYGRGFEKYANQHGSREDPENLEITWIWGDPGTLKSSYVRRLHGANNIGEFAEIDKFGKCWFEYYEHPVLLFDEVIPTLFEEAHLNSHMLKWIGFATVTLPVKTCNQIRRAEHIYMTSNWDPIRVLGGDWAMRRRFNVIERRKIVDETDEEQNARKPGTFIVNIWRMRIDLRGKPGPEVLEGKYIIDSVDCSMTPYHEWMDERERRQAIWQNTAFCGIPKHEGWVDPGPKPMGPELLLNSKGRPCATKLREQAQKREASIRARGL